MPTSTFFNLSQTKRETLMQKFFEEFSQNSYQEASISKIVGDLGISKGIIYKYFQNKQELYYYLIERATQTKLSFIEAQLTPQHHGVINVLWAMIQAGSAFDMHNPVITRFLNRVLSDSHDGFDKDVRGEIVRQSYDFILALIAKGQKSGEVRTDIGAETIAHYVNTVLIHTGEMLAAKHGMSEDVFLSAMRDEYARTTEPLTQELRDLFALITSSITKG